MLLFELKYLYYFFIFYRLKEFENFENDIDPFIDLSPHIRYVLPQDLNLLCSNL